MTKTIEPPAVRLTVPVDRIRNLITGALEGGSNYWVNRIVKFTYPPGTTKADFGEGGKHCPPDSFCGRKELVPTFEGGCMVLNVDNPEVGEDMVDLPFGPEQIARGVQVMAEKYPHHFRDMMSEDDDATTADVFLQCCIFGDCIFS